VQEGGWDRAGAPLRVCARAVSFADYDARQRVTGVMVPYACNPTAAGVGFPTTRVPLREKGSLTFHANFGSKGRDPTLSPLPKAWRGKLGAFSLKDLVEGKQSYCTRRRLLACLILPMTIVIAVSSRR
jgi:hypothetical protein